MVIKEAISSLPDPELVPLFDPLGEGVDPRDLDLGSGATGAAGGGGGGGGGHKKTRGVSPGVSLL